MLAGLFMSARVQFGPGDQFEIKLGRKQLRLIPAGGVDEEDWAPPGIMRIRCAGGGETLSCITLHSVAPLVGSTSLSTKRCLPVAQDTLRT